MPVQFYPRERHIPTGNNKRYSVVDLKDNHPEKFGRYIMALKNLINSDDWGRICGIHGNTFNPADKDVKCPTDPAVVTIIGETGEPFYCKHSVYSFIGWHTPYLYQYELLLNKHNRSSNDDYITLPWLDLTDFSIDFSFLNDPEISIIYDKKRITTENPLAGAYYYVKGVRTRTTRQGFFTPTDNKQRQQLKTVKKQLNNALYASNYERFSSTPTKKVALGDVVDYVPLETPHNQLHDIIGGDSGNMASVDIAAFDPVFWMHHSNMDRHYYTWMHMKTNGFKNSIYPELITDATYNNTCPPFFQDFVYANEWRNYNWAWTNGTGKYMSLCDVLQLNRFPYTYDLIKPEPFVPLTSFVELIDIPVPPETVEYDVYMNPIGVGLDRAEHFAGSAVWFGVDRTKIDCCRCNVALINIKIDIQDYVEKHGINKANVGTYEFVLEGRGKLVKDADGHFQNYNIAKLIGSGSFQVIVP
jgi:hypothetical protein